MRVLARMLVLTVAALPGLFTCSVNHPPQPSLAPAPKLPIPRVAVTGLVVNGVTSRPLPGAIIDLDGHARSETGVDGKFRIDEVLVGVHLLGTRAPKFRSRLQPANIVAPEVDSEGGPRNDFIVLLFAPSAYFETFPSLGNAPACRTDADCPHQQICLMNNFKEMDAPACTVPTVCTTESDCKLGQQCEPVTLLSGEEVRICHGQPAPEVEP